jgi:hypothetical protein
MDIVATYYDYYVVNPNEVPSAPTKSALGQYRITGDLRRS